MKVRQLGKSDLIVSRICFGCWQLSPSWWGQVPLQPWHAAIRAALDCGVTFIDTADAYGDGYAEAELGSFLKRENLRDQFVLATKFYWNFVGGPERYPDTSYRHILDACEASLKRLQTPHIDLYQIHAWDALTRPDEVAAALLMLKQQGKIRHIGVSNLNPEQMALYGAHFDVASLQPPYSLITRDIEARELPYCLQHQIGVIPYSPLYRGLLSGKYTTATTFDAQRADDPLFHGESLRIMNAALTEVQALAADLGLSMPQLAIRWVLTHPAITSAIVGVKKPEHITSIVKAADDVLDQGLWHRIGNRMRKARVEALAASGR